MAVSVGSDDHLAYEEAKRRGAAAAAIVGGALLLVWLVLSLTALNDIPRGGSFAASLARIGDGQAIADLPSLQTATFAYLDDRGVLQVVAAALLGLGAVGAAAALTFVARATRARADRFTTIALYLPPVGAVMVLVGVLMFTVAGSMYFRDIVATDQTVGAVADVTIPGARAAGDFVRFFGNLLLGLGFVLVSLSAMRVGLLTRNMGIIGVLAGALVLFQGIPTYVIQGLWLIALGLLLLRVWPRTAPPAWTTGNAEPWPSAAEERARRQRAAAERRGTPMPPEPEAVEERAASARPHPSSKKKRKRRT